MHVNEIHTLLPACVHACTSKSKFGASVEFTLSPNNIRVSMQKCGKAREVTRQYAVECLGRVPEDTTHKAVGLRQHTQVRSAECLTPRMLHAPLPHPVPCAAAPICDIRGTLGIAQRRTLSTGASRGYCPCMRNIHTCLHAHMHTVSKLTYTDDARINKEKRAAHDTFGKS